MPLTIKPASGSGSATLISVAGTTTNDTLTLPARTGNIITSADSGTVTQAMLASNVAGNGPAFYAYPSGAQSISNATATKINLQLKRFDTNTNFDNSTNYRFTPTVAGYYLISGSVCVGSLVNNTAVIPLIYRNGQSWAISSSLSSSTVTPIGVVTSLIYLNGSTDYVELYVYQNSGTSQNTTIGAFANSDATFFQGVLVRSA